MVRYFVAMAVAMGLTFSTAQPAAAQQTCGKGNQVAGAVIGGLLGGFLGNKIDGGNNRVLGTVLGGALGAFVGSKIAKALDKCEQQKMAEATKTALDSKGSGEAAQQEWTSDSRQNVTGTVTAAPVEKLADGQVCRTVTRVNYVDGQEMQETPRFCRTPPSTSWVAAG